MNHRLLLPSLGLTLLAFTSCGPSANEGLQEMSIVEVSNGFGRLLPHMIQEADENGNPGAQLIAIRTLDDLIANHTPTNPILAPTKWETGAVLPTGAPGNHFIYAEFSQPLKVDSVIVPSSGGSGPAGPITVVAVDGLTGTVTPIEGRAFVGGVTYGTGGVLQTWITDNGNPLDGVLTVADAFLSQGRGFPGAKPSATAPPETIDFGSAFAGAEKLVSPNVFVFIPDDDGLLSTFQTFPSSVQIRMRIGTSVESTGGRFLEEPGLASSTVGVDDVRPEVSLGPPPQNKLVISPSTGAIDVDPHTEIEIEFTEPIQPQSISILEGQGIPTLQSAIQIQFGPSSSPVQVPFTMELDSVYDLTRFRLRTAFDFPGEGPDLFNCGTFNEVRITIFATQFQDLKGNTNALGSTSNFFTGTGPGLVNAPVAPDAIYVASFGGTPSISVIDLNGFGASTGNPTYDLLKPLQPGNSNYPNNPNVAQGSSLIPPLKPGTCTFDGGSEGVFSLTRDSSLSTRLVTSPIIESVDDMMLGHALDTTFNNGPPPFGCQAGGGNACAFTGLKQLNPILSGANTLGPTLPGQFGSAAPGGENIVSWAPTPNPPPMVFPPLCLSPFIAGQEPTSIDTTATNVLTPGPFPFGNFDNPQIPIPPSSLLVKEQNAFFLGPSSPAQAASGNCTTFQVRQQIGQFMYVVDRVRGEVVVLNSNRMSVIERIALPDPTSLAMSPNVTLLAVSNQSAGVVSFIDIDPTSSTFHQVVKETDVGLSPRGLAWEPTNEDILVCNEGDSTVSVISAFSLEVRKVLKNQLNQPFEVAITPRQQGFGFNRGVYFAYILNRDGTVSVFESGPNGPGGWGFDEIILKTPFVFRNPKGIQPDHIQLDSGVWILHEDALDSNGVPKGIKGGAVSNLVLSSGAANPVALEGLGASAPFARDMAWSVKASIGPGVLTGIPVDMAFDDQMNLTGLPNFTTNFSAGTPAPINGKCLVRAGAQNSNQPAFMFLAVPISSQGGGVIDVIKLDSFSRSDTNVFQPGIQSIPATGASILMDYFRQ